MNYPIYLICPTCGKMTLGSAACHAVKGQVNACLGAACRHTTCQPLKSVRARIKSTHAMWRLPAPVPELAELYSNAYIAVLAVSCKVFPMDTLQAGKVLRVICCCSYSLEGNRRRYTYFWLLPC